MATSSEDLVEIMGVIGNTLDAVNYKISKAVFWMIAVVLDSAYDELIW